MEHCQRIYKLMSKLPAGLKIVKSVDKVTLSLRSILSEKRRLNDSAFEYPLYVTNAWCYPYGSKRTINLLFQNLNSFLREYLVKR